MLRTLHNKFDLIYNRQIDGKGLAIFRIVFSLVLLGEVLHLAYFQHLIFDKIPYLIPGEIQMWPAFLFWIISIVFLVFGLFTRIAAIVNYLLSVVVIGTISSYEYHMFYAYLMINFLFIILPISKTISLDRLLLKLKYSNTRFRYDPPGTVSALAYYVTVLFGVGFVYFDSVFFKAGSHLWMNGLGLWLPSSMPQAVLFDITPLLNFKYLVIGLGYLTLVFEAIFLFTFFRRRWRVPLLLIGIGLHVGILICFPIPFFALGVSGIYLLMVPVGFWDKILKRKTNSKKHIKFFYDGECPICNRTRIVLNHFDSGGRIEFLTIQENASKEPALGNIKMDTLLNDVHTVDLHGNVYKGLDAYIRTFNLIWYLKPLSWIMRIPGIYHLGKELYKKIALSRTTERCTDDNCGYVVPELPSDDSKVKLLSNLTLKYIKIKMAFFGIAFLVILQVFVTYNSPLLSKLRVKLNLSEMVITKIAGKVTKSTMNFSKVFFGITHHAVFMDSHFERYNHSVAIVYQMPNGKQKWLPIFDKGGTPGDYLFGPLWVNWTFRVNSPNINQENLNTGIRDFTAFWAYKNRVSLKKAIFLIKVKKNLVPTVWEYDFLRKQLQNPWLDGGIVKWEDNKFIPEIRTIERM
jgi:predicted DCC family thiol-disulfide oxidoreductase YuxK